MSAPPSRLPSTRVHMQGCHSPMAAPAAVAGLIAMRAQRRRFHAALSVFDAKQVAGLQARAALAGRTLTRIEADDGTEAFVLTQGAATIRIPSREAVEATLQEMDLLHVELVAVTRREEEHGQAPR